MQQSMSAGEVIVIAILAVIFWSIWIFMVLRDRRARRDAAKIYWPPFFEVDPGTSNEKYVASKIDFLNPNQNIKPVLVATAKNTPDWTQKERNRHNIMVGRDALRIQRNK